MAEKHPAQNLNGKAAPGDGIRQVKTTNVFRLINFELYTRPVSFVNARKRPILN